MGFYECVIVVVECQSPSAKAKANGFIALISYKIFTFFSTKNYEHCGFVPFSLDDGHVSIRLNLKLQSRYITGACPVGLL